MGTTTVLQIAVSFKSIEMHQLNFNDLNTESQQRLLENSKNDVAVKYGQDIKRFARDHNLDYDELLEVEAMRNLYAYKFTFKV